MAFSGIPILRVDNDNSKEDRKAREERIKKFTSKYFIESDEDEKGSLDISLIMFRK